jgi:hypothetical protein
MLALIWLTFFLHQGDRQVLNAVLNATVYHFAAAFPGVLASVRILTFNQDRCPSQPAISLSINL